MSPALENILVFGVSGASASNEERLVVNSSRSNKQVPVHFSSSQAKVRGVAENLSSKLLNEQLGVLGKPNVIAYSDTKLNVKVTRFKVYLAVLGLEDTQLRSSWYNLLTLK